MLTAVLFLAVFTLSMWSGRCCIQLCMKPGESGSVFLILPLQQAGHYHCQFEWFVRSIGRQLSNKSQAYSTGHVLVRLALCLTLTRWVMASVKKTRSRLEPLTTSLCWVWYIISFSDKNSKSGTWKNICSDDGDSFLHLQYKYHTIV